MKFGYTLIYVSDVEKTLNHYVQAFGAEIGFLHESKQYGELNTGSTKLGFVHHDTASSHGFPYEAVAKEKTPFGVEIGLVVENVSSAFDRAVSNGAAALKEPEVMPWGQTIGYVRDCNGVLVELCSAMQA
ncbi:MAG: VOC family protein [Bdellovibrionota bacterium]